MVTKFIGANLTLTVQQTQAVKSAILDDPVMSTKVSGPGTDYAAIADWLNTVGTFVVWQSMITLDMSRTAIVAGAAQLDNLTQGKRDALLYLASGILDARDANVRQALSDLAGSQNLLKTSLTTMQQRFANRIEQILSSGIGTAQLPATTTFEGTVDTLQIGAILA